MSEYVSPAILQAIVDMRFILKSAGDESGEFFIPGGGHELFAPECLGYRGFVEGVLSRAAQIESLRPPAK